MKLIIGLGNPGKQYQNTRHNAGFMVLDHLAKKLGAVKFEERKKFQAELTIPSIAGIKAILAKPQTFMNNSGLAVKALAEYYKIGPKDIWVINDDLDLPLSTIRIGVFNSSAGHRGIQSVIDLMGNRDFTRIRVGIDSGNAHHAAAEDLVLEKFTAPEKLILKKSLEQASQAVIDLFTKPLEEVASRYN